MPVEICVDNPVAATIAVRCGADRLELCSALPLGGLTPSQGFMRWCKTNIHIPVHIMIRPTAGNFRYADEAFEIMKADVRYARELGFEGIVFGILNEVNDPHMERIKEIVSLAKPMTVTFHRAFDLCRDPFAALEMLISAGIDVILTAGASEKVIAGIPLITELIKKSAGRITIMPGSGINDSNIKLIASATSASWFHLSAGISPPVKTALRANEGLIQAVEGPAFSAIDGDMIRKIKSILN